MCRFATIFFWLICFFLICELMQTDAANYVDPDDESSYPGNYIEDVIQPSGQSEKRACIRRGGNCDHRPNDCCYNSSCRCNLWGSNCRCQRMGLFQKWG